jgi:hypothetical protein
LSCKAISLPTPSQSFIIMFSAIIQKLISWAQQDTTKQLKSQLNRVDTISRKVNQKVDSVQNRINTILNPDINQLGRKLRPKANKSEKDSVRFHEQLKAEKEKTQSLISEAEKSGKSSEKYIRQLDSLNKIKLRA